MFVFSLSFWFIYMSFNAQKICFSLFFVKSMFFRMSTTQSDSQFNLQVRAKYLYLGLLFEVY